MILEPQIGTLWRHLKRGTTYEVVGIAKLQTALTGGLADESTMVIYKNKATGKLSVRSLDEFCDGRFERLGRAAQAQCAPELAAYRIEWIDGSLSFSVSAPWDDPSTVKAITRLYALTSTDGGKLNTEQLDELQFGKSLHKRPAVNRPSGDGKC